MNENEKIAKRILERELGLEKVGDHPEKGKTAGAPDLMGDSENEDIFWEVEVKGVDEGTIFDDEPKKATATLKRNQLHNMAYTQMASQTNMRSFVMYVDKEENYALFELTDYGWEK